MGAGINDSAGNFLGGWAGVYSAQSACDSWTSVLNCYNSYGSRPQFIHMASWIDPAGTTPPPAFPSWPTNNSYTSTTAAGCVAIGQSTVLWQYAGNALVANQYKVDLDAGNPNLDFHTALGQYCPIPS